VIKMNLIGNFKFRNIKKAANKIWTCPKKLDTIWGIFYGKKS
jgi:hypothetical protein